MQQKESFAIVILNVPVLIFIGFSSFILDRSLQHVYMFFRLSGACC